MWLLKHHLYDNELRRCCSTVPRRGEGLRRIAVLFMITGTESSYAAQLATPSSYGLLRQLDRMQMRRKIEKMRSLWRSRPQRWLAGQMASACCQALQLIPRNPSFAHRFSVAV